MLSSRCEPKAAGARFQTKIHGVKVAWFMAAASVYAEQAHSFRVWEAVEASDTLNVGFRLRISWKVVCADGQYSSKEPWHVFQVSN